MSLFMSLIEKQISKYSNLAIVICGLREKELEIASKHQKP
jgi:hypothetical protein